MRHRNFLLFCLMICLSVTVVAQKQTMFIDEFTSDVKVSEQVLNRIRSAIVDGIGQTNRVQLIDALTVNPSQEGLPLENALHYRSQYLLQGRLLNREATDDGISQRYHSRENSYKEKLTLRLQLVRTSDGTTIFSRNYEESGSSSGKDASQYNALKSALVSVPYEMRTFIEQYFKVHGSIVELVSGSSTRAKEVYINLGYNDPITEGQRFDVIVETPVGNRYMGRKIGEIRIKEITGPNFSLCKVMWKGGDDVLEALQRNAKLHIVSRQAKLFDD